MRVQGDAQYRWLENSLLVQLRGWRSKKENVTERKLCASVKNIVRLLRMFIEPEMLFFFIRNNANYNRSFVIPNDVKAGYVIWLISCQYLYTFYTKKITTFCPGTLIIIVLHSKQRPDNISANEAQSLNDRGKERIASAVLCAVSKRCSPAYEARVLAIL